MKLKFTFTAVCVLIAIPVLLIAAKPPAVKWSVRNPLEQKVFVENKGQYSLPDKNVASQDILFGAKVQGLDYYFTKTGIWINYNQPVKRSPQEIEQAQSQLKAQGFTVDNKRIQYKSVTQYHQMKFVGANPLVEITSDNLASGYHNFGIKNSSVKANGFKKITYVNLYPGIDMEVYFREDTTGFEYSFIVHPGADLSQIKIQYPLNGGLSLNNDGNVDIKSAFGTFTDHAPVANQQGTTNSIGCSFALNQGTVQFKAGHYDKSKDLKIDPWQALSWTVTNFGAAGFTINEGYYVDFDDAGNCYVYGGFYPWILAKYDPSGNLLWTFTTSDFVSKPSYYIANFAVDRQTQSVYIIEGFNEDPGSEIDKLNGAGTEVARYNGTSNLIEMWRIAFSRCNPHQAVVGGGNIASGPYNSGFYLDTTLATVTPVNVLGAAANGGYHDVCLLTLDNKQPQSNAYMGFCDQVGSAAGNVLLNVPTPALTPAAWNKRDGYAFITAGTVRVGITPDAVALPVGYSGEAYGMGNDLFTYNGYTLKKWNAATGAVVSAVGVVKNSDSTYVSWAGLTSDLCDNIFVGAPTTIIQYNSSLTQVATINPPAATDTVYDVKLGNFKILYACGQNFLEAIQLDIPYCTAFSADTATVSATCHAKGQASLLNVTGGQLPYTYTWTKLGSATIISETDNTTATSNTVDSLPEGFYVATVTDSECMFEHVIDTIQIKKDALTPAINIDTPFSTCIGTPVVLTASSPGNPGISYTWSPSATLSASTGASVTATPLTNTTYELVGAVTGECNDTIYPISVTVNPLPTINILPNPAAVCSGNPIVLSATGAKTYTWTPPTDLTVINAANGGDSVLISGLLDSTTYTVTGTDINGCVNSTSRLVNIGNLPSVSFTVIFPNPCNPLQAQFITPFDSTVTYLWKFGDSTSSNAYEPTHTYARGGIDTIKLIVTNQQGCIDSVDSVHQVESLADIAVLPDAFAPSDKDPRNEFFKPQINCGSVVAPGYIFRIYNRWGEMVFESDSQSDPGWDGVFNAKPEGIGVYVYYLQFSCGGCPIFRKGNVTLIR